MRRWFNIAAGRIGRGLVHNAICAASRLHRKGWKCSIMPHGARRAFAAMATSDQPLIRTNIGIFGAMNVGKSTAMNLITQQPTSIVDSTPGTTADPKIAMMEIHQLGPVKLFDTPGIDEATGALGLKKKEKAFQCLRECNVALVLIDPFSPASIASAKEILATPKHLRQEGLKALFVVNLMAPKLSHLSTLNAMDSSSAVNKLLANVERELGLDEGCPDLFALDFHSPDASKRLIGWIAQRCSPHHSPVPLLPTMLIDSDQSGHSTRRGDVVLLNIPMDAETPSGRLLRPQALAQEALLRNYFTTVAYRMDLAAARGKSPRGAAGAAEEEQRFRETLRTLNSGGNRLRLVITDSQALDVVAPWTLEGASRTEFVPLTTFSIMMINYMSGGRLSKFVEGLEAYRRLRKGDRVLICEACTHDRIADDIGTVQIPNKMRATFGEDVGIEHSFGREYQTKQLTNYKLLIHCGGCMLDQQKMQARLAELESSGVPVTNYGLLLSYMQSEHVLQRVLRPWQIKL